MDAAPFLGVARSLGGRKWLARPAEEAEVAAISRVLSAPETLARVLAARGVTAAQAPRFMTPRLRDEFPDPSAFTDMDKAAALIWDAVESARSVAVFADYDVDGATSAAQLVRWFRAVGVEADIYVPDRIQEGYGPNTQAFETLKSRGAELVVTVDCGASAHEPLQAAADMGLSVIVIDHHLMAENLPEAAALVNPNRPGDESGCGHMAAAGVTFVLLAALNREGRRREAFKDGRAEPDLFSLIDLAALGTICDVVALTGVNRAITAQGLKAMGGWKHAGLKALADAARVEGAPSVYHAGFLIGPRINAGGRVGRADLGARLLSTDDPALAAEIAAELDALNAERRAIEADVLDQAKAQISRSGADGPILIAAGEGWHPGVIGVAAGRLKEEFGRPVFVIGIENGVGKGSGRSVPGVNLGDAVAAAREAGILSAGGGHAMAAGLTVKADRMDELSAFLTERLAPEFAAADDAMALELDGLISPAGATTELCELLAQAGPFGQGHAQPRFAAADLRVSYADRVGGAHVRFSLQDTAGQTLSGIAFRQADTPIGEALLKGGEARYHAAGKLKLDEWRGRRKVDFQLDDLALAQAD